MKTQLILHGLLSSWCLSFLCSQGEVALINNCPCSGCSHMGKIHFFLHFSTSEKYLGGELAAERAMASKTQRFPRGRDTKRSRRESMLPHRKSLGPSCSAPHPSRTWGTTRTHGHEFHCGGRIGAGDPSELWRMFLAVFWGSESRVLISPTAIS